MRKVILLMLIYFGCVFSGYTQNNEDLIWRLKQLNATNFRASVDNLQKKFGSEYKIPSGWEKALDTIEKDRLSLIEGLKKNDTKTINKVVSLISKLDATLLANPLIYDKELLVINSDMKDKARVSRAQQVGLAYSNFTNNAEIWHARNSCDHDFSILKYNSSGPQIRTIYKPKGRVALADPDLSFDGQKILYSSIGTHSRWHLFEFDLKTGQTRQVTPESFEDFDSFDGCYLPDGRIIFCSTGTFLGLPCTNGNNRMCGLFQFDPSSQKTRQLTFDQDSNWDPVVLPNGKIMYQRWEYADLAHSNSRIMFTMNPDGTEQKAYYGSNSYFPTSLWSTRPIPGSSSKFSGVVGGHHGLARSGRFMLFDVNKGRKEADGVVGEFPYFGESVFPIVRDPLANGVWPQFLHPYPLDENYYIVIMQPKPNALWGVYLADTYNNLTLLYEQEGAFFLNPILIDKRQTPPVIPDRINMHSEEATVYIQDIYQGGGLKGIPRGTVKKLRIGSYTFSPLGQGGLLGTVGLDGPWDIKQIEGVVDVESDGSVMFKIPANYPIFIQPLDAEGKALQMMRSWFTGMPGEVVSCVGCHEGQNVVPVPKANIAQKKKPKKIEPFYGPARGFSFEGEVQPVLDKYCVQCHDGSKSNRPYFKSGKKITDYSSGIAGNIGGRLGAKFSESYYQLQRYVRRPGLESDLNMLVPMDVHADQTELIQIINKGHYGVKLDDEAMNKLMCWIDFNTPYYGRRKDIPTSEKPLNNYLTKRAKYADIFQVKERHLDYMPEVGKITPIKPVYKTYDKGIDSISNWPIKNAQNYQINGLGECFRKRIELGNGIVLNLVRIPEGKMIMGSLNNVDEMPRCEVEVKKAFWIGEMEISNEQYALFDPEHDSRTEHRHGYQFGRTGYPLNDHKQPVVRISWEEAMNYCNWLSQKTNLKFTLPTEAQWEWACRAGSDTEYSFGALASDFTNYANLGDIKLKEFAACTAFQWYNSVRIIDNPSRYDDWVPRDTTYNDGGFVSEVGGRYRANLFALYDMHGNVWEWTKSKYVPYPYNEIDGRNDVNGSEKRVARGGSWYDRPKRATSSYRLPYRPYQKVYNVGFRVVMEED